MCLILHVHQLGSTFNDGRTLETLITHLERAAAARHRKCEFCNCVQVRIALAGKLHPFAARVRAIEVVPDIAHYEFCESV